MLIRDPLNAGSDSIAVAVSELHTGDRTHVVYLIGEHPRNNPFCQSQHLIGIGVEDGSLRWLGSGLDPAGHMSSLVCRSGDPLVHVAYLSNRIARECLKFEKMHGGTAWSFWQPHIKTQADADKLFRYLNHYRDAA